MTLLKIEVKTVTGKYHPEDMIKIWAPALRPNGDTVVSTAPEIVKLVQGKAEVELLPGPARIQLMCGGTLDNAVRKVSIPDAATATLRAVLEDGFDWEPEIVTEVMRYRNEAVAASTSAAEEAVAATNAATNAATSATASATSATASATSAQSAAASKTAASASATNAATSATNAATSADESATHEDTSLDAAAAAIAAAVSVGQFQGQGSPDGQVAAPVGSIYTDLDATNGAIRWIKTSGTGNTGWRVEYGDTGWRDVTALYVGSGVTLGAGAKILIRRVNRDALFKVIGPITPTATRANLFQLITGWQPDTDTWVALGGEGEEARHSTIWVSLENLTVGRDIIGTGWSKEARWSGRDEWPTTLPGTPV